MKISPQEMTDRVEFRWRQHEEHFIRLLAESAREAGRSASDQARELLKTALASSDEVLAAVESLHQELAQLREQLRLLEAIKTGLRIVHENIYELRDNFAASVIRLLIDAGRLDPAAAESWVQQNLDAE